MDGDGYSLLVFWLVDCLSHLIGRRGSFSSIEEFHLSVSSSLFQSMVQALCDANRCLCSLKSSENRLQFLANALPQQELISQISTDVLRLLSSSKQQQPTWTQTAMALRTMISLAEHDFGLQMIRTWVQRAPAFFSTNHFLCSFQRFVAESRNVLYIDCWIRSSFRQGTDGLLRSCLRSDGILAANHDHGIVEWHFVRLTSRAVVQGDDDEINDKMRSTSAFFELHWLCVL